MFRRVLWFALIAVFSGVWSAAQDNPSQPGGPIDTGFRVTEVIPAEGAVEVATDTAITIIFNRPVVPLTILEERDDLPDPVTFMPPVQGEGEWLNTSIYVFRPEPAFAGGVNYVASVQDITSFEGTPVEPFKWPFQTVPPRVDTVQPEPMATDVVLGQPVEVNFNMPMNIASVEQAFSLTLDGQPNAPVAGSFSWSGDATSMTFNPAQNLALDAFYRAQIDGTIAQTQNGRVPLGQAAPNWTFLTVPPPSIVSTSPLDGGQEIGLFEGVVLNFASPMNEDTLTGRIQVDPEPPAGTYHFYSSYNDSYRLNFEAEPSTTYTVTVEPGMEDIYGNAIQTGLTFSYTTRQRQPEVSLQVPDEVGLYDAQRESTELYVAYRNVDTVNLTLFDPPTSDLVTQLAQPTHQVTRDYEPDSGTLIRDWSIDASTIPQNLRRYDLLNMGAPGDAGNSCPGALPSRLRVGDIGAVTTEPDPLRARSEPPGGEIIELMYRDYRFNVVDGPRCIEGTAWFQVTLRDDRLAWIAESVDDEYLVDVRSAAENGSVPVTAENGDALPPGVYFLRTTSPTLEQSGERARGHFMVVATANITLKLGTNEATAWVTNLHTGEPLTGVPVQFVGIFERPLGTATTDENGVASVQFEARTNAEQGAVAVVETSEHFGMGYYGWTQGINPWQFDVNYRERPDQFGAYLYTDRPIYRPDQPVYFRGVVRDKADVTYTPPTFNQVSVSIFDPSGEVAYEQQLQLDAYGAFSDTFMIAEDAALGDYRISISDPTRDDYSLRQLRFSVAEYRLPEYQVEVTTERDAVAQGDDLRANVDADYFFGGGVGNATVEYVVEAAPYLFRYDGPGAYSFRDVDPYDNRYVYPFGRTIADGETTTNAEGVALFDLPTDMSAEELSQELTVEATVRDETGVSVSGRATAIVHKSEVYVGVGVDRYVNEAGSPVDMNVIAVDWDSRPVNEQFVDVDVERWQWVTVQEVGPDGETVYNDELQQQPITSDSVVTNADGEATFSFTPEQGGVYKVLVTSEDDAGNRIRAARIIWVAGDDYVQWRVDNDNTLEIVSDAEEYNIGDTARLLITSPFQGRAEALISVERGGVLMTEHVTMTDNSLVYDLPITADYAPNVFFNVMLVKGVDDNNPVAAFRYGITQLNVETSRKVVNIQIEPDVEQAEPRETVNYTVRTTDYAGEPVRAQVGVALTDLASLSIAPPNSGPILQAFYGLQALSVGTSTPLTINTDELTAYVRDVVKGGGGGGGGLAGIFEIRSEFIDTPYWNAQLETDADGTATFAVTLPDNLTTWRLDARAITPGIEAPFLVGQDTFDLLSTKPLLVRPVTPRFFVVDDQVTLASVVNNNTGEDQTVTTFIEASGLALAGENEQTQTIPDGGRARFEWQVRVEQVQQADVTFFASTEDQAFTDASKSPVGLGDEQLLPVYRYDVPETVGTAGVLRSEDARTEGVQLPQVLEAGGGELSLNVDTSLASVTLDGLDYLRNYPHQCTEQTVSRFLPNILTYQALQELGLENDELRANLDEQVNLGLQVLFSRQNVDGGWGWFSRDDSNTLVTAYVLMGLTEAREAGFAISDGTIQSAVTYLQMNPALQGVPGMGGEDWQFNREAFLLYALAEAGSPDSSRMANLFENRARLNPEATAYLALAFHQLMPDDPRVGTLVSDLVNTAATSATGTFWSATDPYNWTTDTRATAVALEALVTIQPESDLIPNVVRYLISARDADYWETTQETAWAVMALTDWMVTSQDLLANYDYQVSVNGEVLLQETADGPGQDQLSVDVMDMVIGEINEIAFGRGAGDGNLYYTAFLEAYLPVSEVEPASNGLTVSRTYSRPPAGGTGEPVRGVRQAEVGDIIEVRLTLVVPEDRHYVMVEDPIPAGMEAINPDLVTSAQIGTRPELESLDNGWGWWWFSDTDYRDEKVVLYSTYLPAGTYEYVYSLRATVPGTYNVIPTTAQEFYFPDVYGRSAGNTFTVLPTP